MPDAIQILIADLQESRYSAAQQNIIVPVDDFVAALNEIEIAIGGGIIPSTIVLTDNHILVGNVANVGADVAMSGDATIVASGALTIANNAITTAKINNAAVTYAKIQNVASVSLVGNPTGAPAAPEEITLGTNLTFAGTVLNAANSGGNVVGPAGAVASNFASFDGVTGLLIKDSGAASGSFDAAGSAAAAQAAAEAASDPVGSAATAQSNAEAFAANASNLSSGTVPAAQLPIATPTTAGSVIVDNVSIHISGSNKISTGLKHPGFAASRYYWSTGLIPAGAFTAFTANILRASMFYVPFPTTFSKIGIDCNTGSGNLEIGIYSIANGIPTGLLYDFGSHAMTVSQIEITGLTITLPAGVYALAIAQDSSANFVYGTIATQNTEMFGAADGGVTSQAGSWTGAWTFSGGALPGTFPSPAFGTSMNCPLVVMRL